jgi:hypothetical protein
MSINGSLISIVDTALPWLPVATAIVKLASAVVGLAVVLVLARRRLRRDASHRRGIER